MSESSSNSCCSRLRSCPKPRGFVSTVITKAVMGALVFGVVWAITGVECLPGANLFGLVILFLCAVCGGKLVGLIQFPNLPPLPPLLGMLLAGLVLRNVPYITDAVRIEQAWSSALRNIALAIILTRAGLGLNPDALRRLKGVCVRVAVGPCTTEACTVAVVSHFLLGLPWIWGFILGFVLAAVSPAVVVPSMLLLQKEGFGVQKGIPTLLMAAGSFDDILAITGFSTCLGMAFGTGSTWFNLLKGLLEVVGGIVAGLLLGLFIHFFPSDDQAELVQRRSYLLIALSLFSVFGSRAVGFAGAGGLCTLVLAFLAGLSWGSAKVPVAAVLAVAWDIFQPLLFGLIGAEIIISTLNPSTVGLGVAALLVGLVVRVCITYLTVLFAGFNLKEKIFISLAWMPKATVQAAIGSTALDLARAEGNEVLEEYGLQVLTVAVLSILITAPIGAVAIGLAGPRLLQKYTSMPDEQPEKPEASAAPDGKDNTTFESKL
ncbi:sodium/hydrogen exchanger 9B2 [Alosa alosa]|uniref:sodium/hydrogen exchanger 9B2 n=1 Tax=Alosa alosa TaxID=278164 RepID=UPI002015215B|nr:sodium/hydrogen exchanger 9B2 [Alosa alosa]XP_048092315.1 sodium/hydrogen exchanger 9B2 [Alosa alosa]XP_048092316.1 sodium/hydrogen exchanger 9B2 [Alosa alosa]